MKEFLEKAENSERVIICITGCDQAFYSLTNINVEKISLDNNRLNIEGFNGEKL